jgi:hypothetical protein
MLTTAMKIVKPTEVGSLLATSSASNKPHVAKKISTYKAAFEGRCGRPATKSDLYVLLEVHNERLETPTVCLRLVPPAIAIDKGLVRLEPDFGHLYLSAILSIKVTREVTLIDNAAT